MVGIGPETARWEQAFAPADGRDEGDASALVGGWVTNWVREFSRA
ncbi:MULTISPECIES: hypothetical protein [unclassified Streptomyces]|nr:MULTISPECIES: hypothetical protein [unclassified Streptomyces]